jgi:hypothetical protein
VCSEDLESSCPGTDGNCSPRNAIGSIGKDKLRQLRKKNIQKLRSELRRHDDEVESTVAAVGLLPRHPELSKQIHHETLYDNISNVKFRQGLLLYTQQRSGRLLDLIRSVNDKIGDLKVSTDAADELSYALRKADRNPGEESEEEGADGDKDEGKEEGAADGENESEVQIDFGPIPHRLQVSNVGLAQANGVYFLDTEKTHHGRPVFRKQVGDWCLRWQDRHNQIDQIDRKTKEAIGWVLGMFADDD